jgi:1-phosphatidylinositol-4-phosphate 5-kinase
MSPTRKIYFVVMGNIFPPNKELHEIYDLKGSTQGRIVPPEAIKPGIPATLKDLNWINSKRKLILGPAKATLLMNQLHADCYVHYISSPL